MKVYLGVDTSCYTTSLAAVDAAGRVVYDGRTPLGVARGERGLRQSEALFQHIKQLGPLAAACREVLGESRVRGVAASTRPRPQDDSYLPVFLAGAAVGQALAAGAGAPFAAVSHQEGHLRAALLGVESPRGAFLGVHLSGGTTEALLARWSGSRFTLEKVGGTEDLHAGQFIDRLGVAMGLPFPSGPSLEELAGRGRPGAVVIPAAVRGTSLSFSGPLSAAERALAGGARQADLAAAALACLIHSVGKMIAAALKETGCNQVVMGGGVTANRRLRRELPDLLPGVSMTFADPVLAADNAVGVALMARDAGETTIDSENNH